MNFKGDSGGPLECREHDSNVWFLEGVTSHNFEKEKGLHDGYADVRLFKKWIIKAINELESAPGNV